MSSDSVKSNVLIALISSLTAIIVAFITTFGTIAASDTKVQDIQVEIAASDKKVKAIQGQLSDFSNYEQKLNELQQKTEKLSSLPVGTIISSLLTPSRFSNAVGDPSVYDPKINKWVLANGKKTDIELSRYGRLQSVRHPPDLRGMFLRGMNEGRGDGKQDPEPNRVAGAFQPWSVSDHTHLIGIPNAHADDGDGAGYARINVRTDTFTIVMSF